MIRRSVRAVVRKAVLEAHSHVCHYCGGEASEVDHIMPVVLNGTDAPENLIAACKACNRSKKGNQLPPDALNTALRAAEAAAPDVWRCVPNAPIDVTFYDNEWTRKVIALPDSLWDAIDRIRRDLPRRMPSEAETVRILLRQAIDARSGETEK